MYLLIPGRHHALTWFQYQYLHRMAYAGLSGLYDLQGAPLPEASLDGAVFAVTSANHQGTRRNPIPYALRAMAIQDFSGELDIPVWTVGIPDVGQRNDFATYVLKSIQHELGLDLTPANTVLVGCTSVLRQYQALGFQVWGGEALTWDEVDAGVLHHPLPWHLVEIAAADPNWSRNEKILMGMHPACYKLWRHYRLGERVQTIFKDPLTSADGDLTESRDYTAYVRQMDEIAELKWQETGPFVRPGVIGDIGCAVGSWLRYASAEPHLAESDLYGIEIARPLYEVCLQRKANREFFNPNVWFAQRNAVTGLVFEKGRMTTIHTGSLTHEIESYGGRADLLKFLQNRRDELAPEGVWINRDVVGPDNGQEEIYLELSPTPGRNEPYDKLPDNNVQAQELLNSLSSLGLWRQFLQDWRFGQALSSAHEIKIQEKIYIRCLRAFIAEFLLHKDYTDNWKSEMHETFCFWSFSDWKKHLEEAGLRIFPESKVWTNPWILKNRWEGKVRLWKDAEGNEPEDWPPTTMVLVAGT